MAEKIRGAGSGLFGVILGVIEAIFASFLISFATYFNVMTVEITKPQQYYTPPAYLGGIFGAAGSMITFGGVYMMIHAVKKIVDQAFMAYLSSKKSPVPPAP